VLDALDRDPDLAKRLEILCNHDSTMAITGLIRKTRLLLSVEKFR